MFRLLVEMVRQRLETGIVDSWNLVEMRERFLVAYTRAQTAVRVDMIVLIGVRDGIQIGG